MRAMVWSLCAAVLAVSVTAAAQRGAAHVGATGVVEERMDLMKSVGDAMKELTAMMRGRQPYDTDRVRDLAGEIADHGGRSVTDLFPEGSLDHPTEALPAIWSDWDRFSDLAGRMSSYADALVEAADNPRMPGWVPGAGGQGMMGQGMMRQGMMMGRGAGPRPEHLAEMPPDAAFFHLADTCSACHQDFRKKAD